MRAAWGWAGAAVLAEWQWHGSDMSTASRRVDGADVSASAVLTPAS